MPFDRFEGRFTVTGRLEAVTALHLGASGTALPTGTDRPVVRDALGRPYVPGAALKGALRTAVERFVRGVRPGRACDPAGGPAMRCGAPARRQATPAGNPGPAASGESEAEAAASLLAATCWVCRLFGAPWLASRVQVADLPLAAASWGAALQVRNGAAIDRDAWTARAGQRYDYEVVPAGAEFTCHVRAETDDPRLLGMLAIALRELEAGRLLIGGGRSRGLGQVRLRVERRALVRRDADSLLAFLAAPDAAGAAVDDATVQGWVAAFADCLRTDSLPEEAG
jgi:CRISPR-associated RAMP protein (TIGR02581 family)